MSTLKLGNGLHRTNMILVDRLDLVKFSDIKRVGVSILAAGSKIKWFLRVPTDCRAFVHQDRFLKRSFASDIIEVDSSIHRGASNQIGIDRVKPYFIHGVHSLILEIAYPVPSLNRIRPIRSP
jgi:hypothetical protein